MTNVKKAKPKKEYSAWRTIKRIVVDLKPIIWAMMVAAIISTLSVLLALCAPKLVNEMTNIIYLYGENGVPIDMMQMGKLALYLLAAYVGSWLLNSAMVVLMTNITSRYYTKGLRIRISAKIKTLPVSFVDSTPNGELLSIMMNDVSNMSGSISVIVETFINGLIKIVLITYMLYSIHWLLATAVVVLVPFSMVLSTVISGKSEKSWHEFRKVNGQSYAFIEEDFTGFDTVKAFNMEKLQHDKCEELSDDYGKKAQRGYYLSGLVQPIIALTNNIAYVAVCVLGGMLVINNVMEVGDVMEIVLLAKMFAGPLESFAGGISSVQRILACANRVYSLLDKDEMPLQQGIPDKNAQDIVFDNVSFSYDKDHPILKDLSFAVKPGQKVAIVGPTGGGKTTIVNLLMRFYEIDGGKILLGGKDISQMEVSKLREQFGMVLQDTWLFKGTVRENIAYGKDGATFEEVEEAAKQAHADFFIKTLPNGYDTEINEESTNISSGQKQLLTIARSYLSNRKMLILDEATSNVDTRTEILIQEAMDKLLEGRTSFIIAHRLSTIVNADIILVVDHGEIVEQGTHAQLMQKGGFYSQIYNSQYRNI